MSRSAVHPGVIYHPDTPPKNRWGGAGAAQRVKVEEEILSARSHPPKVQIPISRSRAKPGTWRLRQRKPSLVPVAGRGVCLPWGRERFVHFWGETHWKRDAKPAGHVVPTATVTPQATRAAPSTGPGGEAVLAPHPRELRVLSGAPLRRARRSSPGRRRRVCGETR